MSFESGVRLMMEESGDVSVRRDGSGMGEDEHTEPITLYETCSKFSF